MRRRDALSSECPRHHQREFFSPKCSTVQSSSLIHDDIRTCIAQRVRPPLCVPDEERLLCTSDKVGARKRTRHNARRLITAARRGAEACTRSREASEPSSETHTHVMTMSWMQLLLQIRHKLRLNVGFQSICRRQRRCISSSCLALVA
jgi:hypothetical protein